jgi:hypothetical protein
MQENLTKVGVVQPCSCFLEMRTLSQWLQLYDSVGCTRATGCDMYTAYETVLTASQRSHAQRCEFLDELEEFILIMQHYCLVVSSNNSASMVAGKMCEIGSTSIMGFVSGRCEHR